MPPASAPTNWCSSRPTEPPGIRSEPHAALTEAIVAQEADGGPFDLILFGNESRRLRRLPGRRAGRTSLGRPIVNGIKDVEVGAGHGDRPAGEIDAGFEVYELPRPAVLGVKEGLNLPRYPTMRGRLASKKAELTTVESAAAPGGQRLVALRQPPEQVSNTEILGHSTDAAAAVVDLLQELGVLET